MECEMAPTVFILRSEEHHNLQMRMSTARENEDMLNLVKVGGPKRTCSSLDASKFFSRRICCTENL